MSSASSSAASTQALLVDIGATGDAVFVTNAGFLKDDPIDMGRRSSKGFGRMRPRSSAITTALDAIPEMDSVELGVSTRRVSIVSVFENSRGGNGDDELLSRENVKEVAKVMHESITGNVGFTAMKNTPMILLEAYECAGKVVQAKGARLSCTTVIIAGDEVCLAHVGECCAIITDQVGKVIPLTQNQSNSLALGTSSLPEMLHFEVSIFSNLKLEPKRKSLLSSIFTPKESVMAAENVVLTIASSGVWNTLNRDQISRKVQKSLEAQKNDVNKAAQDLIEKASSLKSPATPLSACIIRWSLE